MPQVWMINGGDSNWIAGKKKRYLSQGAKTKLNRGDASVNVPDIDAVLEVTDLIQSLAFLLLVARLVHYRRLFYRNLALQ